MTFPFSMTFKVLKSILCIFRVLAVTSTFDTKPLPTVGGEHVPVSTTPGLKQKNTFNVQELFHIKNNT